MSPRARQAPAPTGATPSGSWRTIVPAITGLVALVAVSASALIVGGANLDRLISDRVNDRLALVDGFSHAGDKLYDPTPLIRQIDSLPFTPGDDTTNELLLQFIQVSPSSDLYVAVVLVDLEGRTVVGRPSGTTFDVDDIGEAVDSAVEEMPGLSPVFEHDGRPVWARTIPVGGDDPWGVMVLVEDLRTGWLQRLYEDLGSLGRGEGGLTLVDSRGVAAASWDPSSLGTQVMSTERRRSIGSTPVEWSEYDGDVETVRVAVSRHGPHASTALEFEQPKTLLVSDLRTAQAPRDWAVVAAAVAAIAILLGFTITRERAIRRSERRAEAILDATDDLVAIVDDADRVVSLSPNAERLIGRAPADAEGLGLHELAANRSGGDQVTSTLDIARHSGAAQTLSVPLAHPDGTPRWFDLFVADRRDHRYIGGVIATFSEVGDRKDLEDALTFRATHDPLTGLANRAGFDLAVTELAAQPTQFAAAIADLDRFKPLNDTLGHEAGDVALRAVADVLRDHVGARGTIGRLGGDEFAFVIPAITEDEIRSLVDRLVADIGRIWPGDGAGSDLSASVGGVIVTGPVAGTAAVMREADAAMYAAKLAGGGQLVLRTGSAPTAPTTEVSDGEPLAGTSIESVEAAEEHDDRVRVPDLPPMPAERSNLSRRLRQSVPLMVTLAALLVAAGVVTMVSRSGLAHAEQDRVDDRLAVLEALGRITVSMTDPGRLMVLAAQMPWDPEQPDATVAVLEQWSSAPSLGADGVAMLVARDGTALAASPADATVPSVVTVDGPHWAAALAGKPTIPPLADDGDYLRHYWIIPVVRAGGVSEILVLGSAVVNNNWSEVLEQLGSLGPNAGGALAVDANGIVVSSWDPSRIGDLAIDPSELQSVAPGEPKLVRRSVGGREQITIASAMPDDDSRRYMLWQQASADLFADLRAGQSTTDLALLGSVSIAFLGLAGVNRRRERLLRQNQARLDALMQQCHTVVAIIDDRHTIRFVSSGIGALLGHERRQFHDQRLDRFLGDETTHRVVEAMADLDPGDEATIRSVEIHDSVGSLHNCDIGVANATDQPDLGGYLLAVRDQTERQHLEQRLHEQATHDPLTGLVNRAEFARHLEALQDDRRDPASDHAVVFLDLDRFKPINDQHGHHVGDEVLRVVSRRIETVIRDGDLVSRHGGDEFAVLLHHCDQAHAEATTERLLAAVRQPIEIDGLTVQVDASAGIALGTSSGTHIGHLMRAADNEMYAAKKASHGSFPLDTSRGSVT